MMPPAPSEGSLDTEEPKLPVHILRTSVGVTVEATFDSGTFGLVCHWSPPPPYSRKVIERIVRDYIPWRDQLLQAAAQDAGIRIMVVTPGFEAKKGHV